MYLFKYTVVKCSQLSHMYSLPLNVFTDLFYCLKAHLSVSRIRERLLLGVDGNRMPANTDITAASSYGGLLEPFETSNILLWINMDKDFLLRKPEFTLNQSKLSKFRVTLSGHSVWWAYCRTLPLDIHVDTQAIMVAWTTSCLRQTPVCLVPTASKPERTTEHRCVFCYLPRNLT